MSTPLLRKTDDAPAFRWLELPAEMASFSPLRDFVFEAAQAAGLGDEQLWKLDLAFEEVITNVIRHAYPQGLAGSVAVGYRGEPECFAVQVRDSGAEFNPLDGSDPDLTLAIEDRPIGGLGRYLVRNLVSRANYQRENGVNVLTFEMSA